MPTKSLFEHAREERLRKEGPLAARMRPRTLDEYIGQQHILAPGRLLRRAIQADQLSSLIFYGPPGTGKTTLASVIANTTKSAFVTLNAVMAGIADLRDVTKEAQRCLEDYCKRTILFVDEVHRWNKAQQDALLPWVENGTIILIGATTENPYFTVNRALVSRSRIFQLQPLTDEDIRAIIRQALSDTERGFGKKATHLDEEALAHLANVANGDARAALNALELAVETTPPRPEDNVIHITLAVAEESIQHRAVLYDREGDCHFDTISAFIKSMRGSDPDATFYWLSKMVYAGEDPRFIFRRMIIFASEDIGMADPHAVQFVMAAADAFDRVGLPEGHFPLAHAALYCATAPKSNSVLGFFDALKSVEKEREDDVPNHLRDASRDQEGFGHGIGYKYPHDYREHWVAQQYLPHSLQGRIYYEPGELGYEATLAAKIREHRELQLAALRENEDQAPPPEILSFSPVDKQSDRWLSRTIDTLSKTLGTIRDALFNCRTLQRHERILDLSGHIGLLTWEAVRRVPEGGVWSLAPTDYDAQLIIEQSANNLPMLRQPVVLTGAIPHLPEILAGAGSADLKFDFIVGRNIFNTPDTDTLKTVAGLLENGGTLALAQNLPKYGQRLSALVRNDTIPMDVMEAEGAIFNNPNDPLVNWDERAVIQSMQNAGLLIEKQDFIDTRRNCIITDALLNHWFNPELPTSYARRLAAAGASTQSVNALMQAVATLRNKTVQFHARALLICARR